MVSTVTQPETTSASFSARIRERRARARFRLTCPVRLSPVGLERFSEHWTEDVSCEGFSCVSRLNFAVGEILDCELTVTPGHWTSGLEDLVLRCQVEVMRTSRRGSDSGYAVACRVRNYTTTQWLPLPGFQSAFIGQRS